MGPQFKLGSRARLQGLRKRSDSIWAVRPQDASSRMKFRGLALEWVTFSGGRCWRTSNVLVLLVVVVALVGRLVSCHCTAQSRLVLKACILQVPGADVLRIHLGSRSQMRSDFRSQRIRHNEGFRVLSNGDPYPFERSRSVKEVNLIGLTLGLRLPELGCPF